MITNHTKESLRAFERRIVDRFAAGELPCLIHLSGGNEEKLIEIFQRIRPEDYIFSTHRNHFHALLKGIPEAQLEADILAGRSMFVYSAEHRFITSAILAGTCPIAVGVAWDIKQRGGSERVYCFIGDGGEEEGHWYEAALFVEAHQVPCNFIIEDNGRQVETYLRERRGYGNARIPLDHFACVQRYTYGATYPHGGAGLPPGSVTFKQSAIDRLRTAA